MFTPKTPVEPDQLDVALARAYKYLEEEHPATDEYAQIVKQIEKLEALRPKKTRTFTPDTLLTVGANLAGIGLILSYEKVNVVATKALGFVMKSRV